MGDCFIKNIIEHNAFDVFDKVSTYVITFECLLAVVDELSMKKDTFKLLCCREG